MSRPHMTRISDILLYYTFFRFPTTAWIALSGRKDQEILASHFGIDSELKLSVIMRALLSGQLRASQVELIVADGPKITQWLREMENIGMPDDMEFKTDYDVVEIEKTSQ